MITSQIVPKIAQPQLEQRPAKEVADETEAADAADSIDELLASLTGNLVQESAENNVSEQSEEGEISEELALAEVPKGISLEEMIEIAKSGKEAERPTVGTKTNVVNPGPEDVKASVQGGASLSGAIKANELSSTLKTLDPENVSQNSEIFAKATEQTEGHDLKKMLNELGGTVDSVETKQDLKEVKSRPQVRTMSGADFLSAKQGVMADSETSASTGDDLSGDSRESLENLDQLLPKETVQFKGQHPLGIRTLESSIKLEPTNFNHLPKVEVEGHVTQGAMATDRFSTEALTGITSQIKTFANQGGGEMTIRLRPDNLGELHVRVNTVGDQVGLQIKASDADAKTILQDSLQYLQESLSKQNMSLGRVNISVAGEASTGNSSFSDLNGFDSRGQSDFSNFSQGNSHGGYSDSEFRNLWKDEGAAPLRTSASSTSQSKMNGSPVFNRGYGSTKSANHQLDLRA